MPPWPYWACTKCSATIKGSRPAHPVEEGCMLQASAQELLRLTQKPRYHRKPLGGQSPMKQHNPRRPETQKTSRSRWQVSRSEVAQGLAIVPRAVSMFWVDPVRLSGEPNRHYQGPGLGLGEAGRAWVLLPWPLPNHGM